MSGQKKKSRPSSLEIWTDSSAKGNQPLVRNGTFFVLFLMTIRDGCDETGLLDANHITRNKSEKWEAKGEREIRPQLGDMKKVETSHATGTKRNEEDTRQPTVRRRSETDR